MTSAPRSPHWSRRAGATKRLSTSTPASACPATAHTVVHDLTITASLTTKDLAAVTTPALVLDSEGSDERLRAWARGVAAALPGGSHRSLPGGWHGVPAEDMAAAVTAFCR